MYDVNVATAQTSEMRATIDN